MSRDRLESVRPRDQPRHEEAGVHPARTSRDHSGPSRILIVDDNRAIHDDFTKVLAPRTSSTDAELDELMSAVFGEPISPAAPAKTFELHYAIQGKHALDMVVSGQRIGIRYSMAFVDMRMPPGWDGLETIERLWTADPDLQIVICTAFSHYSWSEVQTRLSRFPAFATLIVLKKPFDTREIVEAAHALTDHRSRAA